MAAAGSDNRTNQLNPYHIEFWRCRDLPMPPHDEIYEKALELWQKDRNKASLDNRANQKNPDHIEFWRCRGLKKPDYYNVEAGLKALVTYYKKCKESGRKLNPNDYWPLESIVPWKNDEVSGADVASGILFGVSAVAGLTALGLALFGNSENNEQEQRRRRAN